VNNPYDDIRALTEKKPVWFDEHAVPRYCAFTPDETANIYADEVVLAEIHCQDCGREFHVCFSSNRYAQYRRAFSSASHEAMRDGRVLTQDQVAATLAQYSLAHAIETDELHYGDPPNVCCCPAGPTMNSVPVRVLEYWRKEVAGKRWRDWVRVPELERPLTVDWFDDIDDGVKQLLDQAADD
jgi:hypothetical protein